jgi:hypothetical protein
MHSGTWDAAGTLSTSGHRGSRVSRQPSPADGQTVEVNNKEFQDLVECLLGRHEYEMKLIQGGFVDPPTAALMDRRAAIVHDPCANSRGRRATHTSVYLFGSAGTCTQRSKYPRNFNGLGEIASRAHRR